MSYCDEAKKHRKVIRDKFNEVEYVIYSNSKLSKKEAMREIRYYNYERKFSEIHSGEKIMIVCDK